MNGELFLRIRSFMETHSLIPSNGPVLLSLSAGKDSMLLYQFMKEFAAEQNFSFSVFHLNHCMRGAESDADASFLDDLCRSDGVELFSLRHDFAAENPVSFEAKARELRYEMIASLMTEKRFVCAMTAHTKSDQVETVLMRICTGTHIRGLSGIPFRRENIFRPLLCCESEEIMSFLTSGGFLWREDSSNEDINYTRNFIRHQMIPLMQSRFPRSSSTIADLAEAAAESQSVILRLFESLGIAFSEDNGTVCVPYHSILKEKNMFGFCCAELVSKLGGYLSRERIDEAFRRSLSIKDHLVLYDDGGVIVERDRHRTYLIGRTKSAVEKISPSEWSQTVDCSALPLFLGDLRYPLQILSVSYDFFTNHQSSPDYLFFAIDDSESFVLRSRRPGDEISCGGMSRKVKNLLIDLKCDQYEKKAVPIVETDGVVSAVGTGFTGRGTNRIADKRLVRESSKKILAIYRVKTEH